MNNSSDDGDLDIPLDNSQSAAKFIELSFFILIYVIRPPKGKQILSMIAR